MAVGGTLDELLVTLSDARLVSVEVSYTYNGESVGDLLEGNAVDSAK